MSTILKRTSLTLSQKPGLPNVETVRVVTVKNSKTNGNVKKRKMKHSKRHKAKEPIVRHCEGKYANGNAIFNGGFTPINELARKGMGR